ncbi:MAG: TetR/AcrR family transcriptional regulator [Acidobacteriaceae bacterium]
METPPPTNRIAERKLRDKQARRAQIIRAARQIAEQEGWPNVTVRRLSDEISYSQPVLYAHFGSREGILAAVAIEGFQELGMTMEKARKHPKHGNPVESVATTYLAFAASSPALYEVMFSLNLTVPFGAAATPPELRFAFSHILALFPGKSSKAEVRAELFWASLHGIAELSRTKRLPPIRQKERLKTLIDLFTPSKNEPPKTLKTRRLKQAPRVFRPSARHPQETGG